MLGAKVVLLDLFDDWIFTYTHLPTCSFCSVPNMTQARIMAAQERAKHAQGSSPPKVATPASPPSMDLLDVSSPPPAFEESLLPPPEAAAPPPPAFDSSLLPPPVQETAKMPPPMMQFDPMAAPPTMMPPQPQAPSAPAFEDLMDSAAPPPVTTMMPPPVQPPSSQSANEATLDDEALQAILGIEGLTDAEKQEMIAEQMKIMKSIEDNRKSAAVSAADAFESRSFNAAVQSIGGGTTTTGSQMQLHGQERTREAIADGTAVMVQCTACENWMQVTGTAQLMFCPVCQTVSPVKGSGLSQEEAEQMAADAKLAEQLQKEEYESADRSNRQRQKKKSTSAAAATASSSKEQGWMEWLGFGTPAPAPAQKSPSRDIRTTRSTDSGDGSTEGLLTGSRVAKQQPMFACVTDSIGAAVNYATALPEDEEGNVHGVDASSLLAVTQVGREGGSAASSSNQRYERQDTN